MWEPPLWISRKFRQTLWLCLSTNSLGIPRESERWSFAMVSHPHPHRRFRGNFVENLLWWRHCGCLVEFRSLSRSSFRNFWTIRRWLVAFFVDHQSKWRVEGLGVPGNGSNLCSHSFTRRTLLERTEEARPSQWNSSGQNPQSSAFERTMEFAPSRSHFELFGATSRRDSRGISRSGTVGHVSQSALSWRLRM